MPPSLFPRDSIAKLHSSAFSVIPVCAPAYTDWVVTAKGGNNMDAFRIDSRGDVDDLIFAELDYEISSR